MSYIDSQIRELREIAEMYEGMDGGELLKECADTIESLYKKLNEKSNGGWIPCSERLPEENEEVICCFKSGVVKALVLFNCKFHGKVYAYEKSDIIAWQPLPEAYHG